MKGFMQVVSCLAVFGILFCAGCGTTIRDEKSDVTASYDWGVLEAKVDYTVDAVHAAALRALQQMDVETLIEEHDGVSGEIMAHDSQEERLEVMLEALTNQRTQVRIKFGIYGNKNKSAVLFRQIMENLREQ